MGAPFGASNKGLVPLERFWGDSYGLEVKDQTRYYLAFGEILGNR
jgi:hypothetical protein